MRPEEKKGHVARLIELAQIDNRLGQEELIYLKMMALKMGLNDDDFEDTIRNTEKYTNKHPFDWDEKKELFYQTAIMMNIDLVVEEAEVEYLRKTIRLLGINPAKGEAVITHLKENIKNTIDREEVMAMLD